MTEKMPEIRTHVLGRSVEGVSERSREPFSVERAMGDGTMNGFVAQIETGDKTNADRGKHIRELLYLNPLMASVLRTHMIPMPEDAEREALMVEERSFPDERTRQRYYAELLEFVPTNDPEAERHTLEQNINKEDGVGARMLDASEKVSSEEATAHLKDLAHLVMLGGEPKIPPNFWQRVEAVAKTIDHPRLKLSYAVAATYLSRNVK